MNKKIVRCITTESEIKGIVKQVEIYEFANELSLDRFIQAGHVDPEQYATYVEDYNSPEILMQDKKSIKVKDICGDWREVDKGIEKMRRNEIIIVSISIIIATFAIGFIFGHGGI